MPYRPSNPLFYHPTIDLAEQTRYANASAREAVLAASGLLSTSQVLREQRKHWRLLFTDRLLHPDHFLYSCMYCGLMRNQTQEWVAIPDGVGRLLQDLNVPFLSHGICPDCLDQHLPR